MKITPVKIGNRLVGPGQPCYFIAEIGINHNGDLGITQKLIAVAQEAGCDAVKFQKRTPELCVPSEQRALMRETPWGLMSYMDYRHRMEFGVDQYATINGFAQSAGIDWFASCWDVPSVEFMERFEPVCYKVASASLTDLALLKALRATGRPLILSTGMSTLDQVDRAVEILGTKDLVLMHCNSTYPTPPEDINLRAIAVLQSRYEVPVGYSGHEVGLAISVAAVAMGACSVERHITLDRAMWGSDQAASVEPQGLNRLVRDIRVVEKAMGDGVKRVYDTELPVMNRLRRRNVAPEANL